jgi:hypothetical protein
MDVLFECFIVGLIVGLPVWVLMQYLRPRFRFAGLPAFGSSLQQIHIEPVVLRGRFVASAVHMPNAASAAEEVVVEAAVAVNAVDAVGIVDPVEAVGMPLAAGAAVAMKPAP